MKCGGRRSIASGPETAASACLAINWLLLAVIERSGIEVRAPAASSGEAL
jgi:hypothetical protein